MSDYQTLVALGLKTDVPIRSKMLRRHIVINGGCPDCGEPLTDKKFCNGCTRDQLKELDV